MKKLLTVLGAVGLTATAGSAVVACSKDKCKTPNLEALKSQIAKAEKIQQGKKSKTAFEGLKAAITLAKKVTKEDQAPDAYIAIVVAMKAFNESPDMKQVDLKDFKEKAEKIANKTKATIAEAIVAIKEIAKPTGVKEVAVEKDKEGKKIIISFTVEDNYLAVENLELTFVASA